MVPKRFRKENAGAREVKSEVFGDKKARNQLAHTSKNYDNANEQPRKFKNRVAKPKDNGKPKPKKARVYTEKELGIPKLNTAIDPEGAKKALRGKKGKKFVDTDQMNLLVSIVNEKIDTRNASKLEKARQLEMIREQKRKEIEKREAEKEAEIEQKKKEIKKTSRGKGADKVQKKMEELKKKDDASKGKPKKKSVSFA